MKLKDKINIEVLNHTGFDVPGLTGDVKLTRRQIIDVLKKSKRWYEDFAHDCQNQIDIILRNYFTSDEINP